MSAATMLDRLFRRFGYQRIPALPTVAFPTSGRYGVACCRCNRLMGPDGKPVPNHGRFDLSTAAQFDTVAECDRAAISVGWSVKKGNHRCPKCRVALFDSSRRGAYIDTATGLPL